LRDEVQEEEEEDSAAGEERYGIEGWNVNVKEDIILATMGVLD